MGSPLHGLQDGERSEVTVYGGIYVAISFSFSKSIFL